MNYYEELGVSQEATEQEIRKAHRRLVKMMHPDAQPDPNLKRLAETQMRRLNSIVSTLIDPIQRRAYDEQLEAAHVPLKQASQAGRLSWRGIPWWLASAIGAIVLTVGAVWLWADHLGSSFSGKSGHTLYIPPVENPPVAALPPQPDPGVSTTVVTVPKLSGAGKHTEHKAKEHKAPAATRLVTHDALEGEWVYAPKQPERRKAGYYPPEFIDLKLFGSGDPGNLKGRYSAKYLVTDRPVSPEVSFELAAAAKGSHRFFWQSNTGAKGTLNIDSIDNRTIRIDWHTTSAVSGPALTSGSATLVRRQ